MLFRSGHEREALRIHSEHLGDHLAVVVASEPLDGDPGWRPLEPGELAHVKPDLSVSSAVVVEHAPTQVMHLDHPTGQERS